MLKHRLTLNYSLTLKSKCVGKQILALNCSMFYSVNYRGLKAKVLFILLIAMTF